MRGLLAAVVAGLLSAGCGTSGDRDSARGVAERFYAAVARDRGEEACAQLSAAAVKQLEGQSGQACDRVVTRLELPGRVVVGAEVFVTNAKVDLDGGESAYLNRERAGWRLTAVGCTADDGDPKDTPMTCEVEA